ncbi:MAG: mechanosensitive ion channel family protein [Rickettsiales bacterium]|nr:mechanosensitive ion channel family protein [Rickettsiales bacterium]
MWEKWTVFFETSLASTIDMGWMTQVFIVVLFTLMLSLIAGFLLRRLEGKLEKTQTLWDDALIASIRKPLRAIIWILGIGFAAEIIHTETDTPLFSSVPKLSELLFIIVIGWALLRFTRNAAQAIIQHQKHKGKTVDLTTIDAISNLLKASIVITTGLIILQTLGYSINAVLTFGGIGGIAVGFAAKDLLANFFGAMMIYLDRPFSVGDWVRSPDREIEGTIEQIGWRMTTIRTFDKRPLYVPNAVFTQVAVENPSRMSHRRIYETIGIRYDDISQMHAITDAVREMLKVHSEIDESQTLIVHLNAFSPSSCDFFIYTFTHTTNWIKFHEIKQDVLLKIADIIAQHKAEMAFPTQTLHLPEIEQALAKQAG